jgi:hypothetical protein
MYIFTFIAIGLNYYDFIFMYKVFFGLVEKKACHNIKLDVIFILRLQWILLKILHL